MTDRQLGALKYYIDVKIACAMCPSFANEQALALAESELDKAMLSDADVGGSPK